MGNFRIFALSAIAIFVLIQTVAAAAPTVTGLYTGDVYEVGKKIYWNANAVVGSSSTHYSECHFAYYQHYDSDQGGPNSADKEGNAMRSSNPSNPVSPGSTMSFTSDQVLTVLPEMTMGLSQDEGTFDIWLRCTSDTGGSDYWSDHKTIKWVAKAAAQSCTPSSNSVSITSASGDSNGASYKIRIDNGGCGNYYAGFDVRIDTATVDNRLISQPVAPKDYTTYSGSVSKSLSSGSHTLKICLSDGSDCDSQSFTVQASCSSGWKCKDSSTRSYQNADCSWTNDQYCAQGCAGSDGSAYCKGCTAGWTCKDANNKAYQNSDCSFSSTSYCDKGCYNGNCNTCENRLICQNGNRFLQGGDCSTIPAGTCENGCTETGTDAQCNCRTGRRCETSMFVAIRNSDCSFAEGDTCPMGYSCGNSSPSDPTPMCKPTAPAPECYLKDNVVGGDCQTDARGFVFACYYARAPKGTACSTGMCDGNGNCAKDLCGGVTCTTPPGECYNMQGTCSAGSCTYSPKASGTICSIGECDGSGSCKQTCAAGQKCKDASTAAYQNKDCSWSSLQNCGYGCDQATGSCKQQPCEIISAAWSKASATDGELLQMAATTSAGCEGKTVEFTVWEDDGLAALDDYIQTKTATVANAQSTQSWRAAYLDDQWGNPEFYFKAKIDGKESRSANAGVSEGRAIKFNEFEEAFKGKQVVILEGTGFNSEVDGQVVELMHKVRDYTGQPTMIISSPVEKNNCDLYASLSDKAVVVVGTPENNKAFQCLPKPSELENSLSLKRNQWSDDEYILWINATNENFDGVVTAQKMFEYGVNDNFNLGDSVSACFWNGDFKGYLTPEITCNVIPIVELAPDVRDSWKSCVTEGRSTWGVPLANLSGQQLISRAMCVFSLGLFGYDIAGTAADATILLSAAEVMGDIGLSSFKVAMKEALPKFLAKSGDGALREATATAIEIGGMKSYAKILAKAPKIDADVADAVIKTYSHGPEVAKPAIEYMAKNADASWTAKSINGMGYMEKLKLEMPLDYKYIAPTSAKFVSEIFADGAFETVLKDTRKALGTDAHKNLEITLLDNTADMQKLGPGAGSALGVTGVDDDTGGILVVLFSKLPEKTVLTQTQYLQVLKDAVLRHELGHEAMLRQIGNLDTPPYKFLIESNVEEHLANAIVAGRVASDIPDFAAAHLLLRRSDASALQNIISTKVVANRIGFVASEAATARKLGLNDFERELTEAAKKQLTAMGFSSSTITAIMGKVDGLIGDLVKLGDDLAAHPEWNLASKEFTDRLDAITKQLLDLNLDLFRKPPVLSAQLQNLAKISPSAARISRISTSTLINLANTVFQGCQYNSSVCDASHDCVNNECVLKQGCDYANPSCAANQDCVNNKCQLKSGCQYNNPACDSSHTCVNNNCVLKNGCAYNNPSCASNEGCVNNACVPLPNSLDIWSDTIRGDKTYNYLRFSYTTTNNDRKTNTFEIRYYEDGTERHTWSGYNEPMRHDVEPNCTGQSSSMYTPLPSAGTHTLKICFVSENGNGCESQKFTCDASGKCWAV